jgi:hypothetical protein
MRDFGCVGRELRNSSLWFLRGALKETDQDAERGPGCRARGGEPRTLARARLGDAQRGLRSLPFPAPRGPRRTSGQRVQGAYREPSAPLLQVDGTGRPQAEEG